MYADPKHIRDHVVKVRLNDAEMRLLLALAEFNHAQPSALARDLLLDQMTEQQKQGGLRDRRASDSLPHAGGSGGSEAGFP